MKSLKLFAASFTLLCSQAFAAPVTWTDTVNPVDRLITASNPYVFNFDITDGINGFRPLIDTITSYTVSVDLYDDQNDPWYARGEIALINLPGIFGSRTFFNLNGSEYGGESVLGFLELNGFGLLTVGIQSLGGDFYFASATLNAQGEAVPEPASLLLLAAALAAAASATRRRQV